MSDEIKPVSIPKEVCDELERLHKVLMNADGLGWQERRKWAQDQISLIHGAYFKGQIVTIK